ncbi:hypothetical protein [Micromonospora cremea]|uniref:hypothetical protein n=1 Tax=Micromonospora cremea TaxID=709881 RepID=UPI00117DC1AF|nr:hypothetical protein [Micromonospora cremea]
MEVLVDGVWQSAGTVGQNSANPARLDLSGAPRGIQQARLVFTQPSPTDNLARVIEMEIYGWR